MCKESAIIAFARYDINKFTELVKKTDDYSFILTEFAKLNMDEFIKSFSWRVKDSVGDIYSMLIQYGDLNLVKTFHDKFDCGVSIDQFTFRTAAEYGKLDILKWIYENFNDKEDRYKYKIIKKDDDTYNAYYYAMQNKHYHIVDWLISEGFRYDSKEDVKKYVKDKERATLLKQLEELKKKIDDLDNKFK